MNRHWLLASLFLLIVNPSLLSAQEVVVHEAWGVHMETGGGWIAAEKGFYGNVKMNEDQGGLGVSPIQNVVHSLKQGKLAFGVDYPENILRAREKERIDLVAVSVDLQSSAMRIISWKPIISSRDIKGVFGIWPGLDVKIKCVIGKGWEKQLIIQNQGEDIRLWLAGGWPFSSAMTYHELITAQREVKRMGKTFYTIDYKHFGINWMDLALFTTGDVIKKYPSLVQAIVTGRYRGFQWALENPRESFEILKKIREDLDFVREMDAVSPLMFLMISPETKKQGLGYVLPQKWGKLARDMFKAGLLEQMPDVRKTYTERFPSGVMPK